MKIKFENVDAAFKDSLKRYNQQVWTHLGGFMETRLRSFAEIKPESFDLGIDLDEEIPDDQAEERSKKISETIVAAARMVAEIPAQFAVGALKHGSSGFKSVTVPAGCNPLDPEEIRNAFERATDHFDKRVSGATILHAPGAQDAFLAALDDDLIPAIHSHPVRLRAVPEIMDERVLEELFPANDEGTRDVGQDYAEKLIQAAARSPWFILQHSRRKMLTLEVKRLPKLHGPKLCVELAYAMFIDNEADPIVRVEPSQIVIAQKSDIPERKLILS